MNGKVWIAAGDIDAKLEAILLAVFVSIGITRGHVIDRDNPGCTARYNLVCIVERRVVGAVVH